MAKITHYNDPKGKRLIADLPDEELQELFTKTARNEYIAFREANTTIVKAEPVFEAIVELEKKIAALREVYQKTKTEADKLYAKQIRLGETKAALKEEAERRELVVKYPDEIGKNVWGSYFSNERKTHAIKPQMPPSVSLAPVDDSDA